MDGAGITTTVAEAIDDDRLYFARFRTPEMGVKDTDALEESVRAEAEQIEKTVGCVTTVTRTEVGRIGPTDPVDIMLFVLLPRHVDTELFERVVEESRHRAINALLEPEGDE
jgi:hypothetical protein